MLRFVFLPVKIQIPQAIACGIVFVWCLPGYKISEAGDNRLKVFGW
ncbi:hypothetical protein SALWKB12_0455 [Snodgrassella communis]|uniref:Uncharacterized protein n=1 Tax=Snodgrassella communis TaxID=2946699 RepID=A0A836MRM8_9NEIS|nr:hypothetical protein SALWKB12_0455 [Snodgrassella communis]KDN15888.1 hypothetical protein SALWKB29_0307 [Snodgrassella communis]